MAVSSATMPLHDLKQKIKKNRSTTYRQFYTAIYKFTLSGTDDRFRKSKRLKEHSYGQNLNTEEGPKLYIKHSQLQKTCALDRRLEKALTIYTAHRNTSLFTLSQI